MFFPPRALASVFLFIVSSCPPPLQAVKVILYGRYAPLSYEGCVLVDYSFWEDLRSALLLELSVMCPSHHLSLDSYHFSPALLQMLPNLPPCFLTPSTLLPPIFLIPRLNPPTPFKFCLLASVSLSSYSSSLQHPSFRL